MLFVLAYPELPPAAAAWIAAFRARHEPARARLVAAHLTLLFGTTAVGLDELAGRTKALAGAAAPLLFNLDRLERHAAPDGSRRLFLMVGAGGGELAALSADLNVNVLANAWRADLAVPPHLTLATALDAPAIDAAWRDAQGLALPLSGRVAALTVARLADGVLRQEAVCPLGA